MTLRQQNECQKRVGKFELVGTALRFQQQKSDAEEDELVRLCDPGSILTFPTCFSARLCSSRRRRR